MGPRRHREGRARRLLKALLMNEGKGKHPQSKHVAAPCHLTGHPRCPGDTAPAVRGQPLTKSRAPETLCPGPHLSAGASWAPHFLQLMLRRSQVVARPEDPGAYKGAQLLPLTTECVEKQSLVLVSSRGSHSETTGECKKLPTEG